MRKEEEKEDKQDDGDYGSQVMDPDDYAQKDSDDEGNNGDIKDESSSDQYHEHNDL